MIKFEKVSYEQFEKDILKIFNNELSTNEVDKIYRDIKLPKRATKGSAGYDFYAPYFFTSRKSAQEKPVLIPTGIRAILPSDMVLNIYPRSGLGFKYGMKLVNTVGIIDSDYAYSDNEGHIMIKLVHDYNDDVVIIEQGKAFAQGVITKYYTTDDDNVDNERNGGFGSTDSKG